MLSSNPKARQLEAMVHESTLDHTIASYRNIFIVIWRNETSLAGVASVRRYCGELAAQHPSGIFYLAMIEEDARPPSSAARSALAAIMKDSTRILAGAVILEGDGFRTAFVRSIATGLSFIARQSFPIRVCSMDAACDLYEKTARDAETSVDAASLPGIIARLRQAIEA